MAAESDKYILRSGAIDAIKRNAGTLYTREAGFLLQKVILLLKHAPAADVAEVVYGKWENGNPICPVCGENKFKDLDADIWCDWKPDFCPNCGAKMNGGTDDG